MMNISAQLLTKGAKAITIRSFSSDGSYESKDSLPFNLNELKLEKRQNQDKSASNGSLNKNEDEFKVPNSINSNDEKVCS